MENPILKTTITVEFAHGETAIAADVLNLIAAARAGAPVSPSAGVQEAKNSPEPAPEPEPKRPSRPRSTSSRSRRSEPAPEPEHQEENQDDSRDNKTECTRNDTVTHDDIRDLMSEVIEADDENRAKVLKQLGKIGAKSVGTIKDEDLPGFYEFLQTLKD
ncbi:hypothetical protein M087_4215 [Bacteroides fragilis str. S23 R14]|uniref:hypothetical protein n=1 Tax=Bacteroides fragilis TaxID=817 RepID=UPI0004535D0D|nr:hypothetical protein [Bacteroides fragilis]EXZ98237.1 hypothetical protein M087_4215 [Bacteroides fragilis str. S23 R14]EYA64200.1 hypothetical protein M139_4491 [Bacteroides fragilis str. S23L24]EYE41562.1 hypothetical protein M138_4450 [Bacteroides fragilis str. S23L17]